MEKFNHSKRISTYLDKKQEEYEQFLQDLFVGKSISTKAHSPYDPRGPQHWFDHNIKNIKRAFTNGGYFYPEIMVVDENDVVYTLLTDAETFIIN